MASDLALQPPTDGISSVVFSPDSQKLLVSSWDNSIALHTLSNPPTPPQVFSHPAAVLTTTFGSNSNVAYTGGLDKRVREWNFETGQCRVLGKHEDAVSTLAWCPTSNVLISGSWDQSIKVWDPAAAEPLKSSHTMPARVYNFSLSTASDTLLVSMAHRHVYVYNVKELATASSTSAIDASAEDASIKPSQRRESALKFLTRSVACMADGKGWASGSIEGRIAVEYFDPAPESQALKYAFRAHRQAVDGVDCVFPINALAYHPIHNTFASGGSDGAISIWDHNAKKRMKLFPRLPTAVSALAFSPDGSKLAIGASYEHDNAVSAAEDQSKVMLLIKDTVMDDCRPKAAKA